MTPDEHDLLIAAPERWDEACFAVPAVRAVVAAGMGVGVICRDEQQAFWQSVPGLHVLAFPAKTKPKTAATIIRGRWLASLVWHPGFAAETTQLAAVPRRLGPDERPLKKRLTHPLTIVEQPLLHRVQFYLATIEQLGIPTDQPEFFAPATLDVHPTPGAVMLSPDSDFGASHQWPLNRWLDLSTRLIASGHPITVANLLGARGIAQALSHALAESAECFHAAPLAVALPTLARFALVIAADGSLPHLAAHAGATCVTLFGPNDPLWKRPLGRRHAIVHRHVECSPCLLPKCPLDSRCQLELSSERVWATVREKLPT